MKVMITGGAGYIGSTATRVFLNHGYEVVVVDNLSTGHIEAVDKRAKFYEVDIADENAIIDIVQKENIEGVVHFAAFSLVGESMQNPCKYYENNVGKTNHLLNALVKSKVKKIIFSSTAAVYGEPLSIPILETDTPNPTNVYGQTKLTMEKMIDWYSKIFGIKYVSLRYFNVAGAYSENIGEAHNPETHLIPLMVQSVLGKRGKLKVFGNDYDTKDGTCIRDYIHVVDLGMAHMLALEYLIKENTNNIFNLGSGSGYSVLEMINATSDVAKKTLEYDLAPRRSGDPACLVASSKKAQDILKWAPKYTSIHKMIEDAYKFEVNRKY